MRISELSQESRVSIPTIKYYVREGLLPPGSRTAPNQADYGEEHVHRLRLIRALIDVGKLPVGTIRDVIAAIEDRGLAMHDVLGVAHRALAPPPPDAEASAQLRDTSKEVDGFLQGLGWRVSEDSPGRLELAHALATLRRLGWKVDSQAFDRYAQVADGLASWELTQTPVDADREETVEAVVVGTVVFEAVLVALRRLAQEHHSAARFAPVGSRSRSARRAPDHAVGK